MRQIKFRGWDKMYKKWIDPKDYCLDMSDGEVRDESGSLLYRDNGEEIIPVQYTGLKDKNEVEIYEGYIIKHKPYKDRPEQCDEVKFKIYGDNEAYSVLEHYGYLAGAITLIDCIKYNGGIVIGNIYESPELIKVDING